MQPLAINHHKLATRAFHCALIDEIRDIGSGKVVVPVLISDGRLSREIFHRLAISLSESGLNPTTDQNIQFLRTVTGALGIEESPRFNYGKTKGAFTEVFANYLH